MGRIILAEDDPIMGEMVSERLFQAGHAVGWLRDGGSALDAMRFRAPHLAILDQKMPVLHGGAVLQQMRIDPDLAMVPVMMLTSVAGEQDQKIAFYEGADEYLTKPVDLDRMVLVAEHLMNVNRRANGDRDRRAKGDHGIDARPRLSGTAQGVARRRSAKA